MLERTAGPQAFPYERGAVGGAFFLLLLTRSAPALPPTARGPWSKTEDSPQSRWRLLLCSSPRDGGSTASLQAALAFKGRADALASGFPVSPKANPLFGFFVGF